MGRFDEMPAKVIEYSYQDAPTLLKFSQSKAFMRGLIGPFGSGKSSACAVDLIRNAFEQHIQDDGVRRARYAVIRNSYIQLRDTTIKTFLEWLPPEYFGEYWKSEHNYYITKFKGVQIEVMFRALDRPDQIGNLLSAEYTGAWVNEAREVPWTVIEALQGRVGRYPSAKDGGAVNPFVIMDTNPPDTDSSFYRYFEELRPDNAAVFKQPSGLSDAGENLSFLNQNEESIKLPIGDPQRRRFGKLYYENLAKGKDPDFVKVYIHGEYGYVKDGRPVYTEFNDSVHVAECGPISGRPIRRGWDFGLTPACSFSQLQPDGRWFIFDELCSTDIGIDRFSDAVKLHCAEKYADYSFEDFADPAGNQRAQTDEKTCFEILRGKGINCQPGEISDTARIEAVKKALNTMISGKPCLTLHPRCKMLRKGFLGKYRYRRLQTSDERYTTQPDKNEFSHIQDALQYDASKLFGQILRSQTQWKPLNYPKLRVV